MRIIRISAFQAHIHFFTLVIDRENIIYTALSGCLKSPDCCVISIIGFQQFIYCVLINILCHILSVMADRKTSSIQIVHALRLRVRIGNHAIN